MKPDKFMLTSAMYVSYGVLSVFVFFTHPRSPLGGANECVYVLQMFFCFVFFVVSHAIVHKYETTVLGNS